MSAWERLVVALAVIVFLVGFATLDGNEAERSVTGNLQAEIR
ncbi:MAG: hypothetical protein QNJ06_19965 [Kiloniellales bacterium]|nr:hypothetical protein [Kiloniellales bacterium]